MFSPTPSQVSYLLGHVLGEGAFRLTPIPAKSLFVGHFDHSYLRFAAIDTPGILDHPWRR